MNQLKFLLLGAALLLPSCSVVTDMHANGASGQPYSLNFDGKTYRAGTTAVNGETVRYRAYENVVYVQRPEDVTTEIMNIYVPEAYFQGQSIGRFTAQTAPIFLPNAVGGYMPAQPATVEPASMGGMGAPAGGTPPAQGAAPTGGVGAAQGGGAAPGAGGPNAIQLALSRGYVVASPGARGRTSRNAAGEYTGKAPAAIVDLKAAVRYLRFNDAAMPGNAERIVSNGTSAGGALSALLGATGNSADYEPYLKALGAAPARDDIFAVSAYCPITDLDHADAAYEWLFNGVNAYRRLQISRDTSYQLQRTFVDGTLNADQIAVSNALKPMYIAYLDSLGLRSGDAALTLDAAGNGSFKQYVASFVQASAQRALDAGTDLSALPYLTVSGKAVTGVDLDAYARAVGRQKVPPAFDGLSLENAENELFGTRTVNARHFTAYGQAHTAVAATQADAQTVGLMNPLNYIGTAGAQTAGHWRIRHGTADRDTSLAVPLTLAARLQNADKNVDVFLPWNVPHSGDYDLAELFAWMDRVTAP